MCFLSHTRREIQISQTGRMVGFSNTDCGLGTRVQKRWVESAAPLTIFTIKIREFPEYHRQYVRTFPNMKVHFGVYLIYLNLMRIKKDHQKVRSIYSGFFFLFFFFVCLFLWVLFVCFFLLSSFSSELCGWQGLGAPARYQA